MDKREKIVDAINKAWPSAMDSMTRIDAVRVFADAALSVEEPEPSPSLLAVDEDTPEDALVFNRRRQRLAMKKDIHPADWEFYELYIGLNLLPNPGYQPCGGLVVVYGTTDDWYPWLSVREANDKYNNWCHEKVGGLFPIKGFMPVIVKDGHLVAEPERLR